MSTTLAEQQLHPTMVAVCKQSNDHMADGVAPVGVTGAAADGARLHRINLARRQAGQGDLARLREDARWRPTAAILCLHFVGLRIDQRLHSQDQPRGHAIVQVHHGRCIQLCG
jgi:hypothetical protein